MISNTRPQPDGSCWEKRHKEAFTGKRLPFGCLVDYYPTPKSDRKKKKEEKRDNRSAPAQSDDVEYDKEARDETAKFDATSRPGIFLGYRMNSGGRWSKDYLVMDLQHLRNGNNRPSIQSTRKIYYNESD